MLLHVGEHLKDLVLVQRQRLVVVGCPLRGGVSVFCSMLMIDFGREERAPGDGNGFALRTDPIFDGRLLLWGHDAGIEAF